MEITDQKIEALALEKYPIKCSLIGGCGGVRESDKNAHERRIWIEGFKAALEFLECKNKDSS